MRDISKKANKDSSVDGGGIFMGDCEYILCF